MEYYAEQTFEFNGKVLTPTTDVIHDVAGGMYTNEVKDEEGNLYRAYYTQKDYELDRWDEPCGLWEISKEELNRRKVN